MTGATDSTNFDLLSELASLVAAKLLQTDQDSLTLNQWVTGSSPMRPITK